MDDKTYAFIKKQILQTVDVDLNFYKAPQMQRRLGTYLLRAKENDWESFFANVKQNPEAKQALKNYLTINVSSFFRDADKYTYLRQKILPELLNADTPVQTNTPQRSSLAAMRSRQNSAPTATPGKTLRIWSAGCSRGQEPYSLAMLLAEMTGQFTKHYIYATDLDRSALKYVEAGGPYTEDDVGGVSDELFKRYFERKDGKAYVKDSLKKKLTVKQQNMLTDPFEERFDLIVCRNVVIYFTAEVKEMLYKKFYASLRPGGIMFVGGTEIISKATTIGFETAGISFYRRKI